nr:MAG TPA: SOS-response transcriptional repressor [Caudoviricetes sp.]
MKGDRVKNVLRVHGVKLIELAQMLGESQSNTSSLLNGADIKTGLLERISAATGIPISEFFGEKSSISATMHGGNGNRLQAGTGNIMGDGESELVATLKGEIEMLKGIIAEKNADLKDANEKINKFIDLLNKVTEAKV